VRVACSTSNLGPGFDLAGLALSLYLDARAELVDGGGCRLGERSGRAASWPSNDDKLVRAFERAWRELGDGPPHVRLSAHSEIPVGRGLGSSGAAIAAGLLLAAALAPRPIARERLLEFGLELEGHPDNITPALFGGLTFSVPREFGPPVFVRGKLSDALGFAVAWPASEFETRVARGLLPKTVPFADAVENPRRLALLIAGLERGDPELLALGGEDRLHVPYRLDAIPGARAGLAAARAAGAWLATISGAGSALFAIGPRERAPALAEAMRVAIAAETGDGEGRALEVVHAVPEAVRD
jgi:homoserine kinase